MCEFNLETFKTQINNLRYYSREEKETLIEMLDNNNYKKYGCEIIIKREKNNMIRTWKFYWKCVRCLEIGNDIEYPMCYACFCKWENNKRMEDEDEGFLPTTDEETEEGEITYNEIKNNMDSDSEEEEEELSPTKYIPVKENEEKHYTSLGAECKWKISCWKCKRWDYLLFYCDNNGKVHTCRKCKDEYKKQKQIEEMKQKGLEPYSDDGEEW